MTMLERGDGDAGASYVDLAQVLIRHGAHPARDLEELWRRMIFFVCISNTDDHLRNHGFLLEPRGWSLAPAYGMNPVATGDGLSLNLSETENAQSLELAGDVAKHFRVSAARAKKIRSTVLSAVRDWRAEAQRAGLSRAAQARIADAFRVVEAG